MTQAYEERFLFLLLLLRQPRLRMIYVTSMPIDPRIVEYYLALLPGVIPSHALAAPDALVGRRRLDPAAQREAARASRSCSRASPTRIPNRAHSHLIPYNTTELERDIAVTLGIPMYGADPRLAPLGTKTGCRRLFGEVGVPYPLGAEDLHSLDDVAAAIDEMLGTRPSMGQVIVKLNDGVSGTGNALVDLAGVTALPAAERRTGDPRARAPNAVRVAARPVRPVRRDARVRRRDRRGAHRGRRPAEPERAAAGAARRQRRAAVDARPAARRRERAELPRLHVPRRSRLLAADQRAGHGDRRAARPRRA